jgi:hypothetical protein
MTRLIALLVALECALGAGTAPAWGTGPRQAGAEGATGGEEAAARHQQRLGDELKTVAGISEADAKKIIENRPYKSKDDLVQKKVMPKATYDKIKDQIVAK